MSEPPLRTRRFFVVAAEFPALLFGVLRGEPVALRRVIGARGAGRWGIALSLLALVGAAPADALGTLVGAHAVLSLAGWLLVRPRSALALRQHQRILLWACPLLLLAAALLRGFDSLVPAAAALLGAHATVNVHVSRPRALGPDASE